MNAITISQFKVQLLNLTNDEIEDITDPQLVEYLNEVFVTRYYELKNLLPSVYSKKTTLNITTETHEVPLPSDMSINPEEGGFLLYYFNEFHNNAIVPGHDSYYWQQGNVLEFASEQRNVDYNLRYDKEPTYFDPSTVDVSTELILETINSRALSMLKREVEALWHSSDNEGEQTPSSENAQTKANRIT